MQYPTPVQAWALHMWCVCAQQLPSIMLTYNVIMQGWLTHALQNLTHTHTTHTPYIHTTNTQHTHTPHIHTPHTHTHSGDHPRHRPNDDAAVWRDHAAHAAWPQLHSSGEARPACPWCAPKRHLWWFIIMFLHNHLCFACLPLVHTQGICDGLELCSCIT